MIKQAKVFAILGMAALTTTGFGQMLGEMDTAMSMSNTVQGQPGGPPGPVPGQVPGVGNPGAGFPGAPMGGNTMPGPPGVTDAGIPGEMGMGEFGQNQQPQIQLPDPIATEEVLTGRRVYDAVSGALLEDAIKITVRRQDVAAYDDGTNDNGLVGDGIKGKVLTSRNEYIGQFSNMVKNELIHAIHNAEQIDPMVYYGHHVAKVRPDRVEGLKRYGLPLHSNEDFERADAGGVVKDFASIITLEEERDGLVKNWNDKFLARYRVDPNDPQSDYFAVFVPSPPLTPSSYPVPSGYVAPQKSAQEQQAVLDAQSAVLASEQVVGAGAELGGGFGAGDFR